MALSSRLLSLPLELRQEIYIYLFSWSDNNISEPHLAQARSKGLYCGVCRIGFRKDRYQGDKDGCPASIYRPESSTSRSLAILQTCQQINFEATDMIYNKTLFLITNQYTSEPYSYQSSNWRQRTRWELVGSVADCAFLKRMDNVVVDQYLPMGHDGLAVGPKLRLLDGFLSHLDSDQKKSTEVLLRFETDQLYYKDREWHVHPQWEDLAKLLGSIDFGCRPRLMLEDLVILGRQEYEIPTWKAEFEAMLERASVKYDSLAVLDRSCAV